MVFFLLRRKTCRKKILKLKKKKWILAKSDVRRNWKLVCLGRRKRVSLLGLKTNQMCCFFTAIPTFTRSLAVHRFFARPPHWALNSRVSDCFFFPLFSVPSPLFSLEISRAPFPPTVATTDTVKEIQNPVKEIPAVHFAFGNSVVTYFLRKHVMWFMDFTFAFKWARDYFSIWHLL